jgi:hypothetical protein
MTDIFICVDRNCTNGEKFLGSLQDIASYHNQHQIKRVSEYLEEMQSNPDHPLNCLQRMNRDTI